MAKGGGEGREGKKGEREEGRGRKQEGGNGKGWGYPSE